ncbi:glutamyl-tRNA amidotransferase subunit A [Bifidobacterium lemurum]|uniref:Glutamyl-tRNA amidotransferase subunit A n=2 Tax=Bifidobacterium lemurum TaxID=1603886 RepID=A0A261FNJ7_9BIFI|nr:AtzH-like domain-containing protein [Bifidobacterium lemurum]OZG60668.1 glutamyl-tRNA amidotransferase subunit A [Bifidobacterium lemurum]
MANDAARLSVMFADDSDGAPVTRADDAGVLYGRRSIAGFRKARAAAPSRTLLRRTYRMLGAAAAVVVSEFEKTTGGIVLQTQVWQLLDDDWKIVSAHLTYPRPAVDTRVWRVAGSPLVAGKYERGTEQHDTGLPLAGLSVAVKDLYGVEGQIIGAGSEAYLEEGAPQQRNSWPVQRLLDAGADVLGIARTDEFAYSIAGTNVHYGTPPNPQASGRISGGSSSGSASAVAMGQVDIGLGSDTGGSVRVPSSYQHLWGIRTTHGLIPMEGVLPLAQSFDTVGWMTRDWRLLERVAEAMIPKGDGRHVPQPRLSGHVVWADELLDLVSDDMAQALGRWFDGLRGSPDLAQADVHIEHRTLGDMLGPDHGGDAADRLDGWLNTFKVVQGYEAWCNHGEWVSKHWPTLGDDVASRFRVASKLGRDDYDAACARKSRYREDVRLALGSDVLLVPSASGVAPSIADASIGGESIERSRTATMRLTCIAGLSGLPAVNIPLRTADGLPCGVCAVGPAGSDVELIAFAGRLSELASV